MPRKAVVAFVERTTKTGSPDFVPPAERIATFDNDGTLWAEQPLYFQFLFAIDRVKAPAPQHPEWKEEARARGCTVVDMQRDWKRIFRGAGTAEAGAPK